MQKKTEINKLNEYLDSKIAELRASEDKETIALLKQVLGNENDCISKALKNVLFEHNDFIKSTPKLKFYLSLYLPIMEFRLHDDAPWGYLYLADVKGYFKPTLSLSIDIDGHSEKVVRSKTAISDIVKDIVFDPTEIIDLDDWETRTTNLLETKFKCRSKDKILSFEYDKLLDIEKYVDIIRDAFNELGFRLVETEHTDPKWDLSELMQIIFEITVDNPLFEED